MGTLKNNLSNIDARFQIVWSIAFRVLPLEKGSIDIRSWVGSLESQNILDFSSEKTTKNWLDGVDREQGLPSIYPLSCRIAGPAVNEMRVYAQKIQYQRTIHRSFFDELLIGDQSVKLYYDFEVLCFDSGFIVIEIKTNQFNASLGVNDLQRLAYLPKSGVKANLFFYVKRLIRFLMDWDYPNPFRHKENIEESISFEVKPSFVISLDRQLLSEFVESRRHAIVGILTRHEDWHLWESERVEKVLSKDHSMHKDEILLVDKQGLLLVGGFESDIKRYHERFTVIRLMELAYVHNLVLVHKLLDSEINPRLLEHMCRDVKYPHRVTKSVRLQDIWQHLMKEFAVDKRCEELLSFGKIPQFSSLETHADKEIPLLLSRLVMATFAVIIVITSIIALLTWVLGKTKYIGLILVVISSVVFVLLAIAFILVVTDVISREQAMTIFKRITYLLPPFERLIDVFLIHKKNDP